MPSDKFSFDFLKDTVTSYFSGKDLQGMVSRVDQDIEIQSLKQTLGGKRFFFTIDLTTFEIIEIHGLERWLGYSERDFTLRKYWSIVSKKRQQWLMIIALQVYEALCNGKYPLRFMVQRFGTIVPLKHYNGTELLAIKTSSVFQYDCNNCLTAYINEFTIIGDYNDEPLTPDFYTASGEQKNAVKKEIMGQVIERIVDMKVFSPGEMQIARVFAYNPGIKQTEIPQKLPFKKNNEPISYNTVRTFCRRLLEKARTFFNQDFKTPREVAIFLKKEGLI